MSREGKSLTSDDIQAFCDTCDSRDIAYVRALDEKIKCGMANISPPRNIEQLERFFKARALASAVIRPAIAKTELSGNITHIIEVKGIDV